MSRAVAITSGEQLRVAATLASGQGRPPMPPLGWPQTADRSRRRAALAGADFDPAQAGESRL